MYDVLFDEFNLLRITAVFGLPKHGGVRSEEDGFHTIYGLVKIFPYL